MVGLFDYLLHRIAVKYSAAKCFCSQVRPKMILTLTASIMLWSLANKDDKKEASAAMGKWNDAVRKIEVINKFVTSST